MSYWLVKTEPETYSIDDFAKDKITCWDKIRNYQARNNLQSMKVGDLVLVYHSNASPSAIVGIAIVHKTAYPDPSQFDKKSDYFDPKSTKDNPRWFSPDLKFKKKFSSPISLAEVKQKNELSKMELVANSRLSVQKVTDREFKIIELCL
jgi:predicted RNA-binding protein with PUA-like domain